MRIGFPTWDGSFPFNKDWQRHSNMQMPNWDFDRGRYDIEYALTGTDREYLQTKRKSDHPGDPEERIAEKTNKLPIRIHDLLVDIVLLQADERLTEETWEEVLNIAQEEYQIGELDEIDLAPEELIDPTISVGHQFGIVMRSLYEPVEIDNGYQDKMDDSLDGTSRWERLLWGIILAFIGQEFQQIDKEEEAFEELIDEFYEQMKKRRDEVSKRSEVAGLNRAVVERFETYENINLTEYDLEPSPGALNVLRKQISAEPDQSPEKFKNLLEELLEKTPFAEINTVESAAINDMERIQQKKIQSLDADDVFEAVLKELSDGVEYKSDNTVTKEALNDHFPDEEQNNTTQALRALGKRYEHHLWPKEKVIEETNEGWCLTHYGALIAYSLRDQQQSTDWMYDPYLIADGGLEELKKYTIPVLEEFFDEYYDPYWAYFYGS